MILPLAKAPKNVPTSTSPRAPWRDRDDRHRKPALLPNCWAIHWLGYRNLRTNVSPSQPPTGKRSTESRSRDRRLRDGADRPTTIGGGGGPFRVSRPSSRPGHRQVTSISVRSPTGRSCTTATDRGSCSRMVRASRSSSSRWERIAEAYRASGPASRAADAASRGRSNPRCPAANRRPSCCSFARESLFGGHTVDVASSTGLGTAAARSPRSPEPTTIALNRPADWCSTCSNVRRRCRRTARSRATSAAAWSWDNSPNTPVSIQVPPPAGAPPLGAVGSGEGSLCGTTTIKADPPRN